MDSLKFVAMYAPICIATELAIIVGTWMLCGASPPRQASNNCLHSLLLLYYTFCYSWLGLPSNGPSIEFKHTLDYVGSCPTSMLNHACLGIFPSPSHVHFRRNTAVIKYRMMLKSRSKLSSGHVTNQLSVGRKCTRQYNLEERTANGIKRSRLAVLINWSSTPLAQTSPFYVCGTPSMLHIHPKQKSIKPKYN